MGKIKFIYFHMKIGINVFLLLCVFFQTRKEGDNSSDRSGEITPSDSGRGGSEDDLNTSILLSHCRSIDFGRFTSTCK